MLNTLFLVKLNNRRLILIRLLFLRKLKIILREERGLVGGTLEMPVLWRGPRALVVFKRVRSKILLLRTEMELEGINHPVYFTVLGISHKL